MQMPVVFDNTVDTLRGITEDFIKSGFAFVKATSSCSTVLTHGPMMSKYMRTVAKELKRPYLKAEMWDNGCHLTVPKQKRLMPLVAPLLLISHEGQYYRAPEGTKITHLSQATIWQFRFYDMDMFRRWFATVQQDPACRKALKLPPLLQEVTKHAA